MLEGTDIAGLSRARMRPYRKALQMVFQDPFASLNPRWRVGDIIAQGPIVNGTPRRIALEEARELLALLDTSRDFDALERLRLETPNLAAGMRWLLASERLEEVLKGDRVERRRKKPSLFQLLEDPGILEWEI